MGLLERCTLRPGAGCIYVNLEVSPSWWSRNSNPAVSEVTHLADYVGIQATYMCLKLRYAGYFIVSFLEDGD